MKYRLVIFDMDGTLADSFPWFMTVMNAVADKYRFRRVGPDDIATLRGLDTRQTLDWLGVPHWKLPMIARHMRALKRENLDRIPLFPGVEQMLRDLRGAGIRLAIVSSDAEANIRLALGADNAGLIEIYACGASLFGKSSKFKQVLRRSGINASEAIAIGDELRDAEAARRTGIAFGAVAWGYAHLEVLQARQPAQVFLSVEEITSKLT